MTTSADVTETTEVTSSNFQAEVTSTAEVVVDDTQDEVDAAIRIQSAFRGMKARDAVKSLKEQTKQVIT